MTISLDQSISLKSALKLLLEPLHLDYVIRDEVLKITSPQLVQGEVYSVSYPVADLVIPIPNFSSDNLGITGALQDGYSRMAPTQAKVEVGPTPAGITNGMGGDPTSSTGSSNPNVLAQLQGGSLGGGSSASPSLAGSGGGQADNTAPLPTVAVTNAATVDQTAPLPIDRASQTAITATTPNMANQNTTLPPVVEASAEADELLKSGFSELYPADPKVVSAARDELVPKDIIVAPGFMSSGDRQAALSELIQNLQLTYLERAGQ